MFEHIFNNFGDPCSGHKVINFFSCSIHISIEFVLIINCWNFKAITRTNDIACCSEQENCLVCLYSDIYEDYNFHLNKDLISIKNV